MTEPHTRAKAAMGVQEHAAMERSLKRVLPSLLELFFFCKSFQCFPHLLYAVRTTRRRSTPVTASETSANKDAILFSKQQQSYAFFSWHLSRCFLSCPLPCLSWDSTTFLPSAHSAFSVVWSLFFVKLPFLLDGEHQNCNLLGHHHWKTAFLYFI